MSLKSAFPHAVTDTCTGEEETGAMVSLGNGDTGVSCPTPFKRSLEWFFLTNPMREEERF
jgi:hypothetical protein